MTSFYKRVKKELYDPPLARLDLGSPIERTDNPGIIESNRVLTPMVSSFCIGSSCPVCHVTYVGQGIDIRVLSTAERKYYLTIRTLKSVGLKTRESSTCID